MIDQWAVLTIIGLLTAILAVLVYIAHKGNAKAGTGSDWWIREPLRIRAAAVAIVGAIVTLLAALQVEIDPEVQAGIIGVIGAVAFAISELTRPKVTPTAAPNLDDAL